MLSGDAYMESTLFGEREKAVIKWAELVTWNKARYDDEAFDRLAQHFDNTEIVELTTVAAFRGLMNRFMDSLQIELEGHDVQARDERAAASRGGDALSWLKTVPGAKKSPRAVRRRPTSSAPRLWPIGLRASMRERLA